MITGSVRFYSSVRFPSLKNIAGPNPSGAEHAFGDSWIGRRPPGGRSPFIGRGLSGVDGLAFIGGIVIDRNALEMLEK